MHLGAYAGILIDSGMARLMVNDRGEGMALGTQTERDALGRIAEILGITVEDLFTGESAEHLSGAVECLRLWDEIRSASGMKRALNGLSRIAQEERAPTGAEERTAAAD